MMEIIYELRVTGRLADGCPPIFHPKCLSILSIYLLRIYVQSNIYLFSIPIVELTWISLKINNP